MINRRPEKAQKDQGVKRTIGKKILKQKFQNNKRGGERKKKDAKRQGGIKIKNQAAPQRYGQ